MRPIPSNEAAVWLSAAALLAGAGAALFFTSYPDYDLAVSNAFFEVRGRFWNNSGLVGLARNFFRAVFIAVALLAVIGTVVTFWRQRTWLGLDKMRWLYLGLCLIAGPGLVANLAFKNEWGRARPSQVTEFGGTKKFTPPLVPSDQCATNCSFVSGEASSMFAVFFAAAFLFRGWFALWIVAGVAAGAAAGLIRMMQGGHFLSDVIFAGVFMALTVAILDRVVAHASASKDDRGSHPMT